MEAQGRKNLRSEEVLSSGNPQLASMRQEDEIVKGSTIYGEFSLKDQPGIDHRREGEGGKVLQKEKIKRAIEKSPTMRCTEWLPASRSMLGLVPRPAWIAPRAAIGDRGRSTKK